MAIIDGTPDNDILTGTAGDDVINGLSGDDTLGGFAGSDTLDGGMGADTMTGGFGRDTYVVDNAGDLVVETSFDVDTVWSSIDYLLPSMVENLVLTGTNSINGTG